MLAAVGVDSDGKKHVPGVEFGSHAELRTCRGDQQKLLEDLVERGLDPWQAAAVRDRWLESAQEGDREECRRANVTFVVHASCRNHKLRNVLGHLPKDQHPQAEGGVPGGDEAGREAGRKQKTTSSSLRWLDGATHHLAQLGQPTRRPQRDSFTINSAAASRRG